MYGLWITHGGPPLGRGDRVSVGGGAQFQKRAGCGRSLKQVQQKGWDRGYMRLDTNMMIMEVLIRDRLMVGHYYIVNASNCTVKCAVEQPCIVVDLPHHDAME